MAQGTSGVAPRLLFDQNLAPALARRLADLYPGSTHVRDAGLAAADDEAIWSCAAAGKYTIVTKDDDFRQRSFVRGAPPQVIWAKLGNCATAEVETALRVRHADVLVALQPLQPQLPVVQARFHRIDPPPGRARNDGGDEFDRSWRWLNHLHRQGLEAGTRFLARHGADLGVRSSLDLGAAFMDRHHTDGGPASIGRS